MFQILMILMMKKLFPHEVRISHVPTCPSCCSYHSIPTRSLAPSSLHLPTVDSNKIFLPLLILRPTKSSSHSLFSYITCCSSLTILRLNSMLISFITEEAHTGLNIQNAMLGGVTFFCGWCFLFHVSKEISSSLAVTRMEIPRRVQWVFQQEGLEKGMSFGRSLKIKIGVGVRAGTSPNHHQRPWGGRRSGFWAATTLKAREC